MEISHPVADEHGVDGVVAGLPLPDVGTDVQGGSGAGRVEEGLDVREVVAQVIVAAGHADVVWVQTRVVVRCGQEEVAVGVGGFAGVHVKLTGFAHLLTGRRMLQHPLVLLLAHGLHTVGVVHGHGRVVLVLHDWVGEAVADTHALEIHMQALLVLVALEDAIGHSWGIMATKTFTEHEQFVSLEFRMSNEELLHEMVHVFGHFRFVVVNLGAIGIANSSWLINPHNIGIVVPRIRIVDSSSSIWSNGARSVLG